nr:hypothetical protein [Tanacetum cinerariifolium]
MMMVMIDVVWCSCRGVMVLMLAVTARWRWRRSVVMIKMVGWSEQARKGAFCFVYRKGCVWFNRCNKGACGSSYTERVRLVLRSAPERHQGTGKGAFGLQPSRVRCALIETPPGCLFWRFSSSKGSIWFMHQPRDITVKINRNFLVEPFQFPFCLALNMRIPANRSSTSMFLGNWFTSQWPWFLGNWFTSQWPCDNTGGITVGEAIGACSEGIDNSLVASYACVTSIYGSLCKGEKTTMVKRYLVKSFEESGEVFPDEAGK